MRKLLTFVFAAIALAACTQQTIEEISMSRELISETLNVSVEGRISDTRIQLNNDGQTVWTAKDLVSVFYYSYDNLKWQFQGETGDRSGTLKHIEGEAGNQIMEDIILAYPYAESYRIFPSSGQLQAMLPAVQEYKADSYGAKGNIMVAKSDVRNFTLRSVCGWVKIDLTSTNASVSSVALRGNADEQVAGTLYINYEDCTSVSLTETISNGGEGNDGVFGSMVSDGEICTVATLDCGEGVALNAEEPTSFYIAVLPQTFEKGITVDIEFEDGSIMTLTRSEELTVKRNHIVPMDSVSVDYPKLTLKGEATKEFTAEGGNGEFAFELKNAVEGTELTAACEASWVSGVAVDAANSKVTYVVAANDTTEARETKVVLTYGELKVEVAVKQAAGESAKPSFTLKSLSSVTAQAAGADAVIGYKLENPVEGVKVEATVDVEWITIWEIDENKKRIYYYVAETDTREERVGVITATYGEYGSFTVTVTQKGGSAALSVFADSSMEYEYVATRVQLNYQVKFPKEGVEVVTTFEYLSPEGVADWAGEAVNTVNEDEEGNSDLVLNGYVAFNLAANTERGDRTLRVTLAYGDQTFSQEITQKDNFPDDVDMIITEVYAELSNGGKDWTLSFVEYDPALGPATTEIVFGLKEGNAKYVPNGTYGPYSTRYGGIREGVIYDTYDMSGSIYRRNPVMYACAITDADREITVEINDAKQTAKITGHFVAKQYNAEMDKWNAVRVKINWNGPVKGFMYDDPEKEVPEWESFKIVWSSTQNAWAPEHTLNTVEAIANDKNGTTIRLELYSYPAGDKYALPAGTYTVGNIIKDGHPAKNYVDTGDGVVASRVNGYALLSGTVVVTGEPGSEQTFTYNFVDINGTNVKGTYTGTILSK